MNFIKSFQELYSSTLTWISVRTDKLTDFSIGSAARTLVESFCLQLEEFYFDTSQAVRYAIENAIYDAFGFKKKTSSKATGQIQVIFKNPLEYRQVFAKGTQFSTSLKRSPVLYFESTELVTAEVGSISISIPVQCVNAGTIGNIMANEITNIVIDSPIIETVSNPNPFFNGADEESNAERKLRFKEYIRSLQRGTKEAILYGAKTVPGVAGVWVDDRYIGFVNVYAHDSNGNLPEELKEQILITLRDYRAAGIEVQVMPIVRITKDISLKVIFRDAVDLPTYEKNLTELVTNFLNHFQVGDNFYIANLIASIIEGYRDVVVNIVVEQGEDSNILSNELVTAGNVQVVGITLSDWKDEDS